MHSETKQTFVRPLRFQERAELFAQLSVMENAGLSVTRALALVKLPARARARLERMRRSLSLGFDLGDAGARSGLFTIWEASLLRTAVNSGSLVRVYARLSSLYGRRAARLASMNSRLMVPAAMLLVAIFVQPLPQLLSGTLSVSRYSLSCLAQLLALGGVAHLLTVVPQRGGPQGSLRRILGRLLPLLPRFGSVQERRAVRDFLEGLALLVEAGMPILEALPLAVAEIRTPELRRAFSRIRPAIEKGASFTEALGAQRFVGRDEALTLIGSGEASGSLPEMLLRHADAETARIDAFDDQVAEWTPRLVYLGSALLIGYGIVHSGAFLPALPSDVR